MNVDDVEDLPLILDCTLRDGGYLNSWKFPLANVREHLRLMAGLGVDFVEVGFRRPKGTLNKFMGASAFSPDSIVVEGSSERTKTQFGMMIDQTDFPTDQILLESFGPREPRNLRFVRIATTVENFGGALNNASLLISLGYKVFVNIMQCSLLDSESLYSIAARAGEHRLSGLYLADSFGALRPEELGKQVATLVSRTDLPIGVHCHDNLGLALANSLAAASEGASLIDATVLGAGRGAGNTNMEDLLLNLRPETVVTEGFSEMLGYWRKQKETGVFESRWGKSTEYGFAATKNVHPNYVTDLIESEEHSLFERIVILDKLGDRNSTSFSNTPPAVGSEWFELSGETSKAAERFVGGADFLLVGTGPSAERYFEEVREFSLGHAVKVVLVGGHSKNPIGAQLQVVSNPITFLAGKQKLVPDLPIFGPVSQVPVEHLPGGASLSVDLRLSQTDYGVEKSTVMLPTMRSSIFALVALAGLGANQLNLAGFDGYPHGDVRNFEFQRAIDFVKSTNTKVVSLTPCGFDVDFGAYGSRVVD